MARPRLFTIAPHAPFLPTLVARIRDGTLPHPAPSPFGLADLTILVPTRRARTALADAFLQAEGPALLLPDIRALGDADEAELPFLPPYDAGPLPVPVGLAERRLTLAALVARWVEAEEGTAFNASGFASPLSAGEILSLADSLGSLIDACHTEGVPVAAFRGLASEKDLSEHWQRMLKFLDIALSAWPLHLQEQGRADSVQLRNFLLDRLTGAVPHLFGDRPVIAAGSTGSVPATARLLAAIARLPNGALVLPGLDTQMDEKTQAALRDPANMPQGSPQYGLARLLDRLGAGIGEVEDLAPAPSQRTVLVRKALALAEETGDWAESRRDPAETNNVLGGVAVLVARNEDEEARAVATAARSAAAKDKSVGIITPDRNLARRIGAELRRFGIAIDDAAGTPLFQSRAGRLLRGAIAVIQENWAPVPLVSLLRNRHVMLNRSRAEMARLTDGLELGLLRGQRPAPGPQGLRVGIAANLRGELDRPALTLSEVRAEALKGLIDELETALAPLTRLSVSTGFTAADLAAALRESYLTLTGAGSEEAAMPQGADEFLRWAEDIAALPGLGPRFAPRHLAESFEGLVAELSVRAPAPESVGISLLGLLEARLLSFDVVVLAGLNEGVWPAAADPGPWLSRNMMIDIGLQPEERRQGQAAHDFEMALGVPEAVLAFAERISTSPAPPSRLIERLETYAGAQATTVMRARGRIYLEAARALDMTNGMVPASRPMPAPPAAARPRRLAVTDIEKLIRSPYELYAKYVLGLSPLDALGADADARERGTLIHAVMAALVDTDIDPDDPDALELLLGQADRIFAGLETEPARRAVWRRRLMVQGERVLAFEAERAQRVIARHVEIAGRLTFVVQGVDFTLYGRADRIDRLNDGTCEIIDFKTGVVPGDAEMKALLAPQLPAEALMLAGGGFAPELDAGPVSTLTYLRLPADPTGFVPTPFVLPDGMDLAGAIEQTRVRLARQIGEYLLRDDQPMAPDILPKVNRTYEGDYDHLSRRAEWAAEEDAEGEE